MQGMSGNKKALHEEANGKRAFQSAATRDARRLDCLLRRELTIAEHQGVDKPNSKVSRSKNNIHGFPNHTCRTQNPYITGACQVCVPGGAAGREQARWGANRAICPGNGGPAYPPRHRRNIASTSLQKHEILKSFVNRRGNKISG